MDYLSKTIEQNLKSTNEIDNINCPFLRAEGTNRSPWKKLVDRLIDLGLAVILRPHPQTKFQEKSSRNNKIIQWNKNFFLKITYLEKEVFLILI